jgi:DNA-binding LacI/PurR family transcriptional regulator
MINLNQLFDLLQEPSPDPMRLRLRDALVGQIGDGTVKPGEVFPSETVLQNKLKIELNIIHEVVQGLIDTRLIEMAANGEIYVLGKHDPTPTSTSQASQVVGLIASQSTFHVYFGQLAAAFNEDMQKAGWTTEMAVHNEQADNLREIVDQMLDRNVRAFSINPPAGSGIHSILDHLRAQGIPFQLVGRWADYSDCDFINVDNQQIGYLAARHLIELGHSQIIYVGAVSYSSTQERARGYIKAMREAGLAPRIFNVRMRSNNPVLPEFQPYMDPESTPTALWREMVRHRITAAFCFNYDDATWVYNEIRKFNLTVPRDISIVAVDNPPAAGFMGNTLTTFALPGEEIGHQAASLLLRRLAGEDFPPQTILLPGKLIVHKSTSAPREWR